MFWLKLHQMCYQRVLTGLLRSYTILAADRSMNLSLSFQTSLSTAQAFIFFEEISTWLSHGSCVREHDEKDACVQRKNRNGEKNTWSAIVDCIIRVEVKRAESGDIFPSFFFPLLPYHVTLQRMADLRGCNSSVSGISGCAWIKRFLAAAWPSIHHPDLCCAWTRPVTLRWPTDCSMGGWCGKHWDSHLFQFTLCLQASLMGNRFMLIRYSVHRKSHLMLHCKINLILARGGFIYKGVCLVCPTCVRRLHAVSVSAFIGS